jgi:DNA repair protein RecO (recombination protein O)
MSILKTEALVLKTWRFGETSKILYLFTKDYGKIKVIAKGALAPKSPFKGCLETLSHLRIVFYEKKTRELQLLSQADLLDGHIHILGNFMRTTLALSATDLVDKAILPEEPLPLVFTLLVEYLRAMNTGKGFLEAYFWFFETHFIEIMGYRPTWERCLECQGFLGSEGGFFQPENGGLLCYSCGVKRGGLRIEGETVEILYWLQKAKWEEVGLVKPDLRQKAEIRKMFDIYFKTHIEHLRGLKALEFFYGMEAKEGELSET